MSYNRYGGPPYSGPPSHPPYGGHGAPPPGYYPPPGVGAPPGLGAPPPGLPATPNFGPPPGLGAPPPGLPAIPNFSVNTPPPGLPAVPGLPPAPHLNHGNGLPPNPNAPTSTLPRPGSIPPTLAAPPPEINFNAKVIHLGPNSFSHSHAPASSHHGSNGLPFSPLAGSGPDTSIRADPSNNSKSANLHESTATTSQSLSSNNNSTNSSSVARENVYLSLPPSLDDKRRAVFLGRIPEGVSDPAMKILLGAIGKLKHWNSYPSNLSNNKGLRFGFAIFEDVESVGYAQKIMSNVSFPSQKRTPSADAPKLPSDEKTDQIDEDAEEKDDLYTDIPKTKIKVTIAEATEKQDIIQNKLNSEKEAKIRREVRKIIHHLFYPSNDSLSSTTSDGIPDLASAVLAASGAASEGQDPLAVLASVQAQTAGILEDDLADIPLDLREGVIQEIKAFRDRSNRREMERSKREGAIAEEQKARELGKEGDLDAHQRAQRSKYRSEESSAQSKKGKKSLFSDQDEDDQLEYLEEEDDDEHGSEDDETIHRRKLEKQALDEEREYHHAEKRWLTREKTRAAALERERDRDRQDEEARERKRLTQLALEKEWDDAKEASQKSHLYYADHAAWVRKRSDERRVEKAEDERDRRAEEHEKRDEEEARKKKEAKLQASVDETAKANGDHDSPSGDKKQLPQQPQQPFKLSFGVKAQTGKKATTVRKTMADVEGLLDDGEQDATISRRLRPLEHLTPLDDEDEDMLGRGDDDDDTQGRREGAITSSSDKSTVDALHRLAQEIPSEASSQLWQWPIIWAHLHTPLPTTSVASSSGDASTANDILHHKLRPFIEKKVVETLGVQEALLVDIIFEHLRQHDVAEKLIDELAEVLDQEAATDLVKKVWRMVIFYTESQKRGLPVT